MTPSTSGSVLTQAPPLPLTIWQDFASARLKFSAHSLTLRPEFTFTASCEGNYGYCKAPSTHFVVLEDDAGKLLRVHHTHEPEFAFACTMSDDGALMPLNLPVCPDHLELFHTEPSPNSVPVGAKL